MAATQNTPLRERGGGVTTFFRLTSFFIFADGSINREKTHLQIFRQNFLFVFYNAQRD
jgi:hypothetical protein